MCLCVCVDPRPSILRQGIYSRYAPAAVTGALQTAAVRHAARLQRELDGEDVAAVAGQLG